MSAPIGASLSDRSGAGRAGLYRAAAMMGAIGLWLAACAVSGVDSSIGVGVNYGADYYEGPCCYDYGWWGGGYRVGPGHRGEHRPEPPHSHSFRPPPASRPTPSIPSRPRARR